MANYRRPISARQGGYPSDVDAAPRVCCVLTRQPVNCRCDDIKAATARTAIRYSVASLCWMVAAVSTDRRISETNMVIKGKLNGVYIYKDFF